MPAEYEAAGRQGLESAVRVLRQAVRLRPADAELRENAQGAKLHPQHMLTRLVLEKARQEINGKTIGGHWRRAVKSKEIYGKTIGG